MKKPHIQWPEQWLRRKRIPSIGFSYSGKDFIISMSLYTLSVVLCLILRGASQNGDTGYVYMIFLLDVFLTALLTEGFFFSLIISIFAVLSVDYIFTPPYWNVSFTLSGFPLTFLVTMTISVVTGIVTSRAKQMDEVRREAELERMHGNLLIRIVENLLSITRMGGDEAKVNKTPEAAEEIIEGAVGKFTRRWGTDIPVEVHLPEEFLLVPMDPLLMEQVLTNLMENAVLHGKTTRHITVTLCRSGDWARFIVEDDGQGIAPDRLEHLFDGTLQGQQGDRGRSMGIGLSVCRTVVRAHGGRIRGENREEGGARFTVELPLDKEMQQEVDSYEDQG